MSDGSCIFEKLTSQSLVVKYIWELADSKFFNQWSSVISHQIYSVSPFTIHLNNMLANGTNAIKWSITSNIFGWSCHRRVQNCIVRVEVQLAIWLHSNEYLQNYQITRLKAFADTEGYPNPSIITGNVQWLDFAIVICDNLLFRTRCWFWKKHLQKVWS